MATRISTKAVIASTLGLDMAELADYRYQPTRTSAAVYAISDRYFTCCASRGGRGTPTTLGMKWVKHTDQFWAEKGHTIIWVASATEGE